MKGRDDRGGRRERRQHRRARRRRARGRGRRPAGSAAMTRRMRRYEPVRGSRAATLPPHGNATVRPTMHGRPRLACGRHGAGAGQRRDLVPARGERRRELAHVRLHAARRVPRVGTGEEDPHRRHRERAVCVLHAGWKRCQSAGCTAIARSNSRRHPLRERGSRRRADVAAALDRERRLPSIRQPAGSACTPRATSSGAPLAARATPGPRESARRTEHLDLDAAAGERRDRREGRRSSSRRGAARSRPRRSDRSREGSACRALAVTAKERRKRGGRSCSATAASR